MFYVYYSFRGEESCFHPVKSEEEGREIFYREFGTDLGYEIVRIVPLTPEELREYEANRV
jgi:hypothetical protein